MIDVKHYVQYNSFFNKNVKLKTEIINYLYIYPNNYLSKYLTIYSTGCPTKHDSMSLVQISILLNKSKIVDI